MASKMGKNCGKNRKKSFKLSESRDKGPVFPRRNPAESLACKSKKGRGRKERKGKERELPKGGNNRCREGPNSRSREKRPFARRVGGEKKVGREIRPKQERNIPGNRPREQNSFDKGIRIGHSEEKSCSHSGGGGPPYEEGKKGTPELLVPKENKKIQRKKKSSAHTKNTRTGKKLKQSSQKIRPQGENMEP